MPPSPNFPPASVVRVGFGSTRPTSTRLNRWWTAFSAARWLGVCRRPDGSVRRHVDGVRRELVSLALGFVLTAAASLVSTVAMAIAIIRTLNQAGNADANRLVVIAASLLVLPCIGLAVAGAVQMLRLRSYRLCLAAAPVAVLPWPPAWPLGLAVGIWAVVLGFSATSCSPSSGRSTACPLLPLPGLGAAWKAGQASSARCGVPCRVYRNQLWARAPAGRSKMEKATPPTHRQRLPIDRQFLRDAAIRSTSVTRAVREYGDVFGVGAGPF